MVYSILLGIALWGSNTHAFDCNEDLHAPKKIGVFVGAFDPPHLGHQSLVEDARLSLPFDAIYPIPDSRTDYKPGKADSSHRNAMLDLLFQDVDGVVYPGPEIRANMGSGQLWEIFAAVQQQHPEDEVYLLMGTDTFEWYARVAGERALPPANIVVSMRDPDAKIPKSLNGGVVITAVQSVNTYSSTDIRGALRAGTPPVALPPALVSYISRNALYGYADHSDSDDSTIGDPHHWIQRESGAEGKVGNVGLEVVANPDFYRKITADIADLKLPKDGSSLTIIDCGAGTGKLARDLMTADPTQIIGLSKVPPRKTEAIRSMPIRFLSFEKDPDLVAAGGNEIAKAERSHGPVLEERQLDLGTQSLPLPENSVDLAISRTLLMHLDLSGINRHLREVYRALKPGAHYHVMVLDPRYQLDNLRWFGDLHIPKGNERISFQHGETGSLQSFTHYYRDRDLYVALFQNAGFKVLEESNPTPLPGWENSHSRYYDQNHPVFLYFQLVK